jgi:glycosyltransferase involved in cell wall biosynthesis
MLRFNHWLKKVSLSLKVARHWLGFELPTELYYVVPGVNWSLDWDGRYITSEIQKQFGWNARVIDNPRWLLGQIIHYGSLWAFLGGLQGPQNARNTVVTTIFHGDRSEPAFEGAFERLFQHQTTIRRLVVANTIMADRFISWGMPKEKVVCIPLGVDTDLFQPPPGSARVKIREIFGLSEDAFCIGSFQKDGDGWEEGYEPKLIKGPDIFLQVIERLARRYQLHVFLTAPARGYVKKGLEKIGVPYTHVVLSDYHDLAPLYHALDAYLVTSREEGGPKGVLEALASGVPLVSTRVGLAPDVVRHDVNGLLADVEDVDTLVEYMAELIEDAELRDKLAFNGLSNIAAYRWSAIARRYYEDVYLPLLN